MIEGENFIIKDLIPLLNILELTNSWDIYMELEQVKQLKIKIEKQNIEIDNLKTKITTLEQEITKLTKKVSE